MSRRLGVFRRLEALYLRMEREYADAARDLGLSCAGCADNCCTSYFQHHTYLEWAFLWQGLEALVPEQRETYLARARDYLAHCAAALAAGRVPDAMCPVNDHGRCGLYSHRLMICRLHGVPNFLRAPGGAVRSFPGCWQARELAAARPAGAGPGMDRTPLYLALAGLEREFLGARLGQVPRVDLTLAQMLANGRPRL